MADGEVRRPKRRNAVKHNKIVEIKGHKFVLTYFKQFTFCGHCTRFLWWGIWLGCVCIQQDRVKGVGGRGWAHWSGSVSSVCFFSRVHRGVTGPQGYRCICEWSKFQVFVFCMQSLICFPVAAACDFTIHKRCLDCVSFICPGTNLPEGLVSAFSYILFAFWIIGVFHCYDHCLVKASYRVGHAYKVVYIRVCGKCNFWLQKLRPEIFSLISRYTCLQHYVRAI